MNWLSKIDSMVPVIKTAALEYWVVAAVVGLCMAVISGVIAVKNPALRSSMRRKMRIFRYCHSCKYADLTTETCALYADRNEKCGFVDATAGMSFSDPTKL